MVMAHGIRQKKHGSSAGKHFVHKKRAFYLEKKDEVPAEELMRTDIIGRKSTLPDTPFYQRVARCVSSLLDRGEYEKAIELLDKAERHLNGEKEKRLILPQ